MAGCLEGIRDEICIPYLDDVLVFSKDFDSHLEHLRIVLQRLRDNGMKLKPRKCSLYQDHVKYLGHVVLSDGYCVDTSNVKAVESMREYPPKTVGDVRRIVGLLNYYCKYMENFSKLAKPLFDLLQAPQQDSTTTKQILN